MLDIFNKSGDIKELLENEDVKWDIKNNNGYLKLSNGFLICFGKGNFSITFTKIENMYKADIHSPFTFAIPFSNLPIVICCTADNEDYCYGTVNGVIQNKTGINSINLIRPNSTSGVTALHYIAIGFWK